MDMSKYEIKDSHHFTIIYRTFKQDAFEEYKWLSQSKWETIISHVLNGARLSEDNLIEYINRIFIELEVIQEIITN